MLRWLFTLSLSALVAGPCSFVAASDNPDYAGIRGAMKGTWDKPDSPVVVEPIILRGDHALAGWTQGDMGGRALLRRKASDWIVIFCAGDDLKRADVLHRVGLPQADADALAAMLAVAEKASDPARVAMFSRFEGLVQVAGDSHGPRPDHAPREGQPKGH